MVSITEYLRVILVVRTDTNRHFFPSTADTQVLGLQGARIKYGFYRASAFFVVIGHTGCLGDCFGHGGGGRDGFEAGVVGGDAYTGIKFVKDILSKSIDSPG